MNLDSLKVNTVLKGTFEDVCARTKKALVENGFGVLTEIDIQAKMKEKLGIDRRPYLIFGACDPKLANQALGVSPYIGLLMPCNVCVFEQEGGDIEVAIFNPGVMAELAGDDSLQPVADAANAKVQKVIAALNSQ